jgi:hypothetical protein
MSNENIRNNAQALIYLQAEGGAVDSRTLRASGHSVHGGRPYASVVRRPCRS